MKPATLNFNRMPLNHTPFADHSEDRAPILGAWSRLYTAVIAELVVLIIVFYLFMKAFE